MVVAMACTSKPFLKALTSRKSRGFGSRVAATVPSP